MTAKLARTTVGGQMQLTVYGHELLENPLVGAVLKVSKLRHQGQGVKRQALMGVALGNGINVPVNACTAGAVGQKSW